MFLNADATLFLYNITETYIVKGSHSAFLKAYIYSEYIRNITVITGLGDYNVVSIVFNITLGSNK